MPHATIAESFAATAGDMGAEPCRLLTRCALCTDVLVDTLQSTSLPIGQPQWSMERLTGTTRWSSKGDKNGSAVGAKIRAGPRLSTRSLDRHFVNSHQSCMTYGMQPERWHIVSTEVCSSGFKKVPGRAISIELIITPNTRQMDRDDSDFRLCRAGRSFDACLPVL